MSQRGVEIVLGRLATDEAIRERFERAPGPTLRELTAAGIELNAVELAALDRLDREAVDRFAQTLDPRLRRAVLDAQTGVELQGGE